MAYESMLGEIVTYGFGFPPKGYLACDGTLLQISKNQALYSILGTTYGGDGATTFALPDLRGRVPVHQGNGTNMGQSGGEETHALTVEEMPAHTHSAYGTLGAANQSVPTGQFWASNTGQMPFSNQANTKMAPQAIGSSGAGQGHENMSPFQAINFAICNSGSYGNRIGTLGEIILYGGQRLTNPDHWLPCNGQLLQINQNTALYSLLRTTYGGDGKTTFALPDLRGFAPLQCGQGKGLTERTLGQKGGSSTVTLMMNQMASHSHQAMAAAAASSTNDPSNAVWAVGGEVRGGVPYYAGGDESESSFHYDALTITGGEQPHNNMPPYLGVNFLICINGVYPQRQQS